MQRSRSHFFKILGFAGGQEKDKADSPTAARRERPKNKNRTIPFTTVLIFVINALYPWGD